MTIFQRVKHTYNPQTHTIDISRKTDMRIIVVEETQTKTFSYTKLVYTDSLKAELRFELIIYIYIYVNIAREFFLLEKDV